ncbi:MAG: sodium-translocating pyrophosphatase [Planctomycetes bacterium]|nr:sodium-translocating pyrophosphatase [Planctomycetota bacterium]NOG52739.1 sodium-translocating pyrophosphatase [Planctomycetota bacterium]
MDGGWLGRTAEQIIPGSLTLAGINEIPALWYVAPVGAVCALIMALLFFKWLKGQSEGDPDMIEIADAVRQGAMAYLRRQYKVVSFVFVVLVVVLAILSLGLGLQPTWSMIGVPVAGFLSGLCGWFGMKTATHASARTANAARNSLNDGLKVAFRSGAVMGLIVVGFALLDISIWFFLFAGLDMFGDMPLTELTVVMLSFGMGASTQALFARVGGGIYTKAADVGADLVGKVEAGIPEDDPRNPATIADNVGDNVGDVAGMGADLYESYYGSILSSMALGAAAAFSLNLDATGAIKLTAVPMCIAGLGIICSILGIFTVKTKEGASFNQLLKSLHFGVWASSAFIIIGALAGFYFLFKDVEQLSWLGLWGSIVSGLVAGLVIAWGTEYYTSYEHAPTKRIAEQARTGPATVIISGIAEGMMSTWIPLIVIVIAILCAYGFAGGSDNFVLGLFGVGIAAVGMLSTLGITLATDAYGPIADNAGGNAEMTGQEPHVRERTDMLDALGNTTAATGKGFAIGSAALTAMALLAAYTQVVQQQQTSQAQDWVAREGIQATSQVTAHYEGYGKWAIVGEDGTVFDESDSEADVVGALMLGSDHLIKDITAVAASGSVIVPLSGDVLGTPRFLVSVQGENGPIEFDLVRADRASIRDIMTYYNVTLMNPRVLGGLFLGVLLAFVFCALTMNAVGRAAYRMMGECHRQFGKMKEAFRAQGMSEEDIADPMKWPTKVEFEGIKYPQYAECVAISTAGAQREMVIPALMAIIVPVVVGLVLGVAGVMGLLMGGLSSGFAIAIFMANAGGAWDNAKKYIETGQLGGKGSDAHKAGVVGDTVGDPFKDTSGPSLNILIKLISIVSVVFAGLVVKFGPVIGHAIGLD